MEPWLVEASGSVMYSGWAAAMTGWTTSGEATVVRPAPLQSDAYPARMAAPDLPVEPPTTRTWPKVPLCESAARTKGSDANSRGFAHRTLDLPTSSISSRGEPMSTTSRTPHAMACGAVSCPILGAVKVTVQCAASTGPSAVSPTEERPDGVSTASVNAGIVAVAPREWLLMSEMARAIRPVAGPFKPVPSIASTMAWADDTSGQSRSQSVSAATVST